MVPRNTTTPTNTTATLSTTTTTCYHHSYYGYCQVHTAKREVKQVGQMSDSGPVAFARCDFLSSRVSDGTTAYRYDI